jgi:hypothetical protein
MSDDDAVWKTAEDDEMGGLVDQKVFVWVKIADVPQGIRILTTRWVFDLKTDEAGNILKNKARIVVRGYEQREGI